MMSFWNKFKKYYQLLINSLMPLIIFLIPVYSTNYIDGLETITYHYNFYKLFNFNLDSMFSCFMLLILLVMLLNLILFIILMFDSYKLLSYRKIMSKFVLTLSYIFSLTAFAVLIYAIYTATLSHSGIFIYNNSFGAGSVILLIYTILQNIILTNKFKRREL